MGEVFASWLFAYFGSDRSSFASAASLQQVLATDHPKDCPKGDGGGRNQLATDPLPVLAEPQTLR
ncbi:MAG: hypothetical protein Q7Q71_13220 [Verrucomicrobiota bacterium JB023]|nr:hypothetical protein [Verrucomicrobiota bacterium JB023]